MDPLPHIKNRKAANRQTFEKSNNYVKIYDLTDIFYFHSSSEKLKWKRICNSYPQ
jgi:hypothetical protein